MAGLWVLLLILASAACPAPVWAIPTLPDARREIQASLIKSDYNLSRKDIRGCMAGFPKDFQGTGIAGNHYNKAGVKQSLLKSFSYAQSITAHTLVKDLQFIQGKAVVMSQEHTVLTIRGRRTHRLHTLVFDGLWRGVWRHNISGWQEQSENQITSTVTTDGVSKIVLPAKSKDKKR